MRIAGVAQARGNGPFCLSLLIITPFLTAQACLCKNHAGDGNKTCETMHIQSHTQSERNERANTVVAATELGQ